jgi:hypothetical protein
VRLNELYLESPPAFRKVFADAARSPALARRLADSNNSVVDFVRSLTAATVT